MYIYLIFDACTQERLLGAALGSIFMGVLVFEQRKMIYKSIAENQPQLVVPQSHQVNFVSPVSNFVMAMFLVFKTLSFVTCVFIFNNNLNSPNYCGYYSSV